MIYLVAKISSNPPLKGELPRGLETPNGQNKTTLEWKLSKKTNKFLLVKHDAHVFRGNTLGLPKICPEENIGAIDRQTLYTYLSAFHRYMSHQIRDHRFIYTDSGLPLPPCWQPRWWVVWCCRLGIKVMWRQTIPFILLMATFF